MARVLISSGIKELKERDSSCSRDAPKNSSSIQGTLIDQREKGDLPPSASHLQRAKAANTSSQQARKPIRPRRSPISRH